MPAAQVGLHHELTAAEHGIGGGGTAAERDGVALVQGDQTGVGVGEADRRLGVRRRELERHGRVARHARRRVGGDVGRGAVVGDGEGLAGDARGGIVALVSEADVDGGAARERGGAGAGLGVGADRLQRETLASRSGPRRACRWSLRRCSVGDPESGGAKVSGGFSEAVPIPEVCGDHAVDDVDGHRLGVGVAQRHTRRRRRSSHRCRSRCRCWSSRGERAPAARQRPIAVAVLVLTRWCRLVATGAWVLERGDGDLRPGS